MSFQRSCIHTLNHTLCIIHMHAVVNFKTQTHTYACTNTHVHTHTWMHKTHTNTYTAFQQDIGWCLTIDNIYSPWIGNLSRERIQWITQSCAHPGFAPQQFEIVLHGSVAMPWAMFNEFCSKEREIGIVWVQKVQLPRYVFCLTCMKMYFLQTRKAHVRFCDACKLNRFRDMFRMLLHWLFTFRFFHCD